ncbi:MAG: hypothetical protein ACYDAQ_20350 [Mycobacteriales bacterium]
MAAVPVVHPWDEQVGPFYDTSGLRIFLGVTKQAIADRVRRRTLLAVVRREGQVLYPAFQFRGREMVPGLNEVLAVFREVRVDGWVVAAWLTTPAARLGWTTPVGWLSGDGAVPTDVGLAADAAGRWAA